jgi:outer membrane protein OmpA-like peptidoglycan-associated protein
MLLAHATTSRSHRLVAKLGKTARTIAIAVPLLAAACLQAAAQTPASPAAAAPVPFAEAVTKAARLLFKAVPMPPGDAKVEIVIDPLLDGRTGIHTIAAADTGRRLAAIARSEFPRLAIVDFNAESLARKPLVLIGIISLVDVGQDVAPKAGQVEARPPGGNASGGDAPPASLPAVSPPAGPNPYTVWFTLADSQTREVVAKGRALAAPDGVDMAPTPAQADSPVWRRDAAVQAYIESCEKTKVGDQITQAYAEQIPVSAVITEADQTYAAGRAQKALGLYRKALAMPGGEQLRALNGIYVSLARLQKKNEAAEAFGALVDYGLQSQDLAVKILFRPGTAQFIKARDAAAYPMWLRQIATKAASRQSCMEVVGHTSPTGPAAVNDRLSQLRAETIRHDLDAASRGLGERIIARGMGSRENIVGTGKDDNSDALDRRVEFKVLACS